jgi:hypothetical protein
MLILNILPNQFRSYFVSHCPHKIPITPKLSRPKLLLQSRKLLKYLLRTDTLQNLYNFSRRILGRCRKKYMNMIHLDPHRINLKIILLRYFSKQLLYPLLQLLRQNLLPIFWNPNEMILDIIDCMLCSFNRHAATISYFPCLRHEGFHPHPYRWGIPPYFL